MINKVSGTKFENELCKRLNEKGFWCRPMYPAPDGSQPFDVMVINKRGYLYCIECKDCKNDVFGLNRIEDNQDISLSNLINKYCLDNRVLFAFDTSAGTYLVVAREVLHLNFLSGFSGYKKTLNLKDMQKIGISLEQFIRENS